MKIKKYHPLFVVSGAIAAAGFFIFGFAEPVQALSAPTIISPQAGYVLPPDQTLKVTGVSPRDAAVYVFVDGKLNGGVKVKNGRTGAASFAYTVKGSLAAGTHTIEAQAIVAGEKSGYTEKISFTVPKVWPRRLDGVIVDAAKANMQPIGVMVENLSTVRPQSGLASASVVYEALAEGGVPRFLAIFARDDMVKVGPVRSARPYYADWAKEYGAALLHAGGSQDAFKEIGALKVRSIDALVNRTARYFSRVGKGVSTHNLFALRKQIQSLRKDYKIDTAKATFDAWKFKDDPALANRPNNQKQLSIDFKSGKSYIVGFRYQKSSNSFERFNGGKAHLDANYPKATQIRAKNVVVQLIEKERVIDRQKHLALQVTGTGKGWLAQDGTIQQITWKKTGAAGRTKFYYGNGKEVEFNRGATWIEVVPKDRPVIWK